MIELYGSISPNVQKIIIALAELDLPHEFRPINVHRNEQLDPEFLKLNPLGKTPVIVDHDGSDGRPVTIFESGAILLYLAERHGALLPRGLAARTEAIQWMMFQMTAVGPVLGQFNHFVRFATHDEYGCERFTSSARKIYDEIEQRLTSSPYLGGDEFSLADVATFPWLRTEARLFGDTHPVMRLDWDGHPAINEWCRVIEARPGVARALEQIDAMKFNRGSGTDDQMDRLFGRGRHARTLG